ncbi:interleukin-2 receptor subunit alpha [Saccopteryx bilineata]|uniref:interleukin-2 receptor subunit alpha n=1 Tax=Saccopteryx bilineata TaxID=59482 RepID=UPI00339076D1
MGLRIQQKREEILAGRGGGLPGGKRPERKRFAEGPKRGPERGAPPGGRTEGGEWWGSVKEERSGVEGFASGNTEKKATPKPKEQKEGETTEMPSHMQPTDQINPGHCREPPPWEDEASKRKYYFVVGQTVYYECAPGFRALQRGPAKRICKMTYGKTIWTKPPLKCTNESDEKSQTSLDAPWGSETSCPLITTGTTTDFQNHADVAITSKMFTFTTEYQIAVAGCILLLLSVLLLSVLTW